MPKFAALSIKAPAFPERSGILAVKITLAKPE
jgi:hypothetical protein